MVQTTHARRKVTRSVVAVGRHIKVARPRDGAAVVDAHSVVEGGGRVVVVGVFRGATCAARVVVTSTGQSSVWVEVACRRIHAARARAVLAAAIVVLRFRIEVARHAHVAAKRHTAQEFAGAFFTEVASIGMRAVV